MRALLALALGALGGTFLKWLDDSFTPLATLRRRQRRVEQYLRWHIRSLPEGVVRRLEDVRSAIASYDSEGVAGTLDEIVKNQDALVNFSSGVEFLEDNLDNQRGLAPRLALASVPAALEVEEDFIRQLRSRIWPWEKTDELTHELDRAQDRFRNLTVLMRRATLSGDDRDMRSVDTEATRIARSGADALGKLLEETAPVNESDTPAIIQAYMAPERGRRLHDERGDRARGVPRRTLAIWLLDNAWWLTLGVGASVVTLVGFQAQFVDNAAFEGDARDYLQLAAWALAIQVAGGTVLETVGKLRTASRSEP